MFENLPTVSRSTLESFMDGRDFEIVTKELKDYVEKLADKNYWLFKVINDSAETSVALGSYQYNPELEARTLGNCLGAILLVLGVIDRELGNMKLERVYGKIKIPN